MPRAFSWLVFGVAWLVSACDVPSRDGTAEPTGVFPASGSLTVDWTIVQTKEPAACRAALAENTRVVVFDANGAQVGVFAQSCTAFVTRISLDAGSYAAEAQLVDAGERARSRPVMISAFELRGSSELTIPIDFPASSLF